MFDLSVEFASNFYYLLILGSSGLEDTSYKFKGRSETFVIVIIRMCL